jgi:N-acetylglucosaminylphosphatidylinositol deacetylase
MKVDWDAKLVSNLLVDKYAPRIAKRSSKQPPETDIDVILTFDRHGISSHPNHRSLYHGAVAFLREISRHTAGWEPPVKVYTLTTVNILRKYLAILDAPASVLSVMFSRREAGPAPSPLFSVSSVADYRRAQTAMTTAHQSQMAWFRWGWIGCSRYMFINVLKKQN